MPTVPLVKQVTRTRALARDAQETPAGADRYVTNLSEAVLAATDPAASPAARRRHAHDAVVGAAAWYCARTHTSPTSLLTRPFRPASRTVAWMLADMDTAGMDLGAVRDLSLDLAADMLAAHAGKTVAHRDADLDLAYLMHSWATAAATWEPVTIDQLRVGDTVRTLNPRDRYGKPLGQGVVDRLEDTKDGLIAYSRDGHRLARAGMPAQVLVEVTA